LDRFEGGYSISEVHVDKLLKTLTGSLKNRHDNVYLT
jgi:hypothetical protein